MQRVGNQLGNRDESSKSTVTAQVRQAIESGGVVLLRGGAGCGKTTVALELYEHFCDSLNHPRCCIITPNTQHREYVTSQLLGRSSRGVLVSPQVTTFAGLVGRILAASQNSVKSISPFERYFLLRNIITQLNNIGKLPTFAPVCQTSGIVTIIDRAIAELKRTAVDENDLEYALSDAVGKSRDLLTVYTLYQQRLRELELFDVEGQMWCGRDILKNTPSDTPNERLGLDGIDVIAIDGFTDFTPTQLETLALLVPRIKGMLITIPFVDDRRERMWFWTRRTLKRIRTMPVANITEIELPAPAVADDSLQNILPRIFDHDAQMCAAPAGLGVIVATGIDSEVACVARKIKRLLSDGAKPRSIGVIARSLDTYHETIVRIFSECDIPVTPPAVLLGDVPVVRFFLDVAEIAESNFAFAHVLHVIKNSYFRPQALGNFSFTDVLTAETIIRNANVAEGRRGYEKSFERAEKRSALQDIDQDPASETKSFRRPDPTDIKRAGDMLKSLFDLTETAYQPCGLLRIIDALDLRTASWNPDDIERSSRDIRAVDTLRAVLASLEESPAKIGIDSEVDVSIDIKNLREAVSRVSLVPVRRESLVDVTSVLDARAIRWEHVFLLGLGEGQFPQKITDLSLLSEKERQTWNQRGIDLDRRSDLTAREMLLFYLAVSRADKTITLSYHHGSAADSTTCPAGSFLQSLTDTVGGEGILDTNGQIERIKPGEFVPDTQQLTTPRQTLNAAITGLFQRVESSSKSPLRWIIDNRPELLTRVGCGFWASRRRWETGVCNEFDGRITDSALLKSPALQYFDNTVFSASRLNMYGWCPWRYFAKYLLHIEPMAEPEKQLEPVSLGIFCHDVLCSTFTELTTTHSSPLRLRDIGKAEIFETFEKCFNIEAALIESQNLPYPVLWKIQQQRMRQYLRDYLNAQYCEDSLDFECLHFEFGFGVDTRADHLDTASISDPVTISTPAGPVKLCGKIDRIDHVKVEDIHGLFVVDYKTGQIPKNSGNADEKNLQMYLYAEAVEQIFNRICIGGAFHSLTGKPDGYFAAFKKSGKENKIRLNENFEQQRSEAMDTVGKFVTSMREGRFDLNPRKPDVCGRCDYRPICHFSPARSEVKFPATQKEQGE